MFDIATGQATQVAQHDAPIKVVKWVDTPQAGILATGSWDKTIKVHEYTLYHHLLT
jgi:mRNA export factor